MSTWVNEAGWDRTIRILAGAVLLGVAYFGAIGTFRVVLLAFGTLLLVTGVVGFCPAYRLVGLNTCTLGKR